MRVTLFGKPGCCLCDDARVALERVREEGPAFELEEVDVSVDPRLHRLYGERIPVLAVDGEDRLELGFDEGAVRRVLSRVGV